MVTEVLRIDVHLWTVMYPIETTESWITKVEGWIILLGTLIIVSPTHVGGHNSCVSRLDRPHGCGISMPSRVTMNKPKQVIEKTGHTVGRKDRTSRLDASDLLFVR